MAPCCCCCCGGGEDGGGQGGRVGCIARNGSATSSMSCMSTASFLSHVTSSSSSSSTITGDDASAHPPSVTLPLSLFLAPAAPSACRAGAAPKKAVLVLLDPAVNLKAEGHLACAAHSAQRGRSFVHTVCPCAIRARVNSTLASIGTHTSSSLRVSSAVAPPSPIPNPLLSRPPLAHPSLPATLLTCVSTTIPVRGTPATLSFRENQLVHA